MRPELREKLRKVALAGLAGLAVAAAYALIAPSWYTARLAVVSLKRSSSVPVGIGQQMSELRELGLSLPGMGGGSADRVAAVLGSESVSDAVIEKFNLKERYGKKYQEQAREELWDHCAVKVVP